MSTNQEAIPDSLVEDKLVGLEREDGSVADEICDKRPVSELSGMITVVPTKQAVARGGDSLKQIGADLDLQSDEVDKTTFVIKRAGKAEKIEPSIIKTIDERTGRDELERKMRKARNSAHADIDSYLQSELTDSSKNKSFDVKNDGQSGANGWADNNGTPLYDLQEAFDEVPGADTMFIGRTDEKNLKNHPDLLAEFSNFDAGQLGPGQLANVLQNKFPRIQNLVIGNRYFSDQNEQGNGVALNLGYELANTTWMGHQRGLIMCEFDSDSPVTRMSDPKVRSGSQVFAYERKIDILRPPELSDMGQYFTNTT